jgi:hypothetical protein
MLSANPACSNENGYSATDPELRVSPWRDCIFFTGMMRQGPRWLVYYGGSEY